jgi:hypothetical protein
MQNQDKTEGQTVQYQAYIPSKKAEHWICPLKTSLITQPNSKKDAAGQESSARR